MRPWIALAVLLASGPALAATETFDCVIEPSLSLRLGSPITGIVTAVEVDRGDAVERGQVLARLESSVEVATLGLARARAESNAEIEARRARLEQTRSELSRAASLHSSAIVTTQRIEELRANSQVAASDLAIAVLNRRLAALEVERSEALLEQRTIRSPVSGIVTSRNLGPGEYIHFDNHILAVAQLDPLYVETFLPVRLHGQVAIGSAATVRPDPPLGGSYRAEIRVMDTVFDAASGTFGVRLNLANPDRRLPGGVRCRVEFELGEAPAAGR
ncbi:MAG: efflux RND transporter periplasmic adaptor subunit [Roseococcus sp.]